MKNRFVLRPRAIVFAAAAASATAGIYVGETDDAPGAALLGLVGMIVCGLFAAKASCAKA